VVHAVVSAVQKSGAVQIGQEAVHGADWQPREPGYLLRGQSAWRFAEELQQTQPALQGRNVVAAFWMADHEKPALADLKSLGQNTSSKMKVRII
jgi:hypothetical protein